MDAYTAKGPKGRTCVADFEWDLINLVVSHSHLQSSKGQKGSKNFRSSSRGKVLTFCVLKTRLASLAGSYLPHENFTEGVITTSTVLVSKPPSPSQDPAQPAIHMCLTPLLFERAQPQRRYHVTDVCYRVACGAGVLRRGGATPATSLLRSLTVVRTLLPLESESSARILLCLHFRKFNI